VREGFEDTRFLPSEGIIGGDEDGRWYIWYGI
jgi:hypothetical protein